MRTQLSTQNSIPNQINSLNSNSSIIVKLTRIYRTLVNPKALTLTTTTTATSSTTATTATTTNSRPRLTHPFTSPSTTSTPWRISSINRPVLNPPTRQPAHLPATPIHLIQALALPPNNSHLNRERLNQQCWMPWLQLPQPATRTLLSCSASILRACIKPCMETTQQQRQQQQQTRTLLAPQMRVVTSAVTTTTTVIPSL